MRDAPPRVNEPTSGISMSNDMQQTSFVSKGKHKRDGGRWSRSGCLTCKKRRKRCDETKPSCNNCVRLGRTCEGYGSLWAEPLDPSATVFQQPGTPHKRRRLSSPSTQSDTISDISSVSSPTVLNYNDNDNDNDNPFIETTSLTLAPTPSQHHLSTNEAHYLQYHIEQGSRLLANHENDDNPLRSLLVPRALISSLLRNATCAMSAMHFSNRAQDGSVARTAATNYYIQTVRQLRGMLAGGSAVTGTSGGDVSGSTPDELIIAVGILCKYEVVRGSVRQWAVHLDALRKLIIARGGYRALEPETAEFIWGFFVYAHNIAKVTNDRYRRITAGDGDDLGSGGITKLDIYVGYTEDILILCSRIADLPSLDRLTLEIEVGDIDHILQTWSPKPYIYPSGITQGSLVRLQAVAECFRDAAYIHLHSTLEGIPPSQVDTQADPQADPQVDLQALSRSKTEALDRCLARIASFLPGPETAPELTICPAHCEFSALTFPLFFAGCECQTAEQREIVLTALELLESGFGIGNVNRVREVLGVLWMRGRKDWGGVLGGMGWELIVA